MKEQHFQFSYLWLSVLAILIFPNVGNSQTQVKVTDDKKVGLIGVYVSADSFQETTDINGQFILPKNLKPDEILTLEYVGFKDFTISISNLKAQGNVIQMLGDNLLLEEIIIIGRTEAREIDLPYKVKRIAAQDIYASNAQTTADALELNGGAYIQKSQMGGGSPVLRGFEANKVLMVVDGVRMNNAIYRNGHLQNAITIDPAVLQQMEVIFGAGSLLYGSEALGGVIHFRTKSPLLNFDELQDSKQALSTYIRYNSANQEKRIHADYTFSKRKWGVLSSFTISDYNDLKAGSNRRDEYPDFGLRSEYVSLENGNVNIIQNENPNVQIGTAFSQIDFLQKWAFELSDNLKTELNLQYSTSSDIPRYDNLAESRNGTLRFAEWYYGPQNRLLISPKLTYKATTLLFEKMTFIASFQNIEEDRISRSINDLRREHQEEDVSVLGFTLDFNKRINPSQKLVYGADFHYNNVSSNAYTSDAFDENVQNVQKDILTRYPSGGSQLSNFGAFVQHNWQNSDSSMVWINGLRWSTQNVSLLYNNDDPFTWPQYFYEGIKSTNSALVGISGLNINKGNWVFRLSTGTSFRSPNVDDLAKVRVNGNEITVPNPDLDSEKVWNNEINIGYRTKHATFTFSAYYTRINDAIVRQDFTLPDGSSMFITPNDTLIVTGNMNANSGIVKGVSGQLDLNFNSNFHFKTSVNIQSGIAKNINDEESPLGHIPPTFGNSQLDFKSGKYMIALNHRYNLWKHIEDFGGSVDNPDLATADGSPSWHIFGFNTSYNYNKALSIQIGLDNIFDIHYRPFSSGLSGAGRNISISLKYDWK